MAWDSPEYAAAVHAAEKAAKLKTISEISDLFNALAKDADLVKDPAVKALIKEHVTAGQQKLAKLVK
jgi:hypothetical protein